MFKRIEQRDDYAYPQAADMLHLGANKLLAHPGFDHGGARNTLWLADDALPAYVRNNVALDMAAQRQLRFANDQLKQQVPQMNVR